MQLITALELDSWLKDSERRHPVLLDVRELVELQHGQIPNSVHISMHSVPDRLAELDKSAPTVCICHHGARSMQVARFLEQQEFEQVYNLTGGVHAWATQVDPKMETY